MEQPVPVKEVKILETAEDIQERREQVRTIYICVFVISTFANNNLPPGPQQVSGVQGLRPTEAREVGGQPKVPILQTRC